MITEKQFHSKLTALEKEYRELATIKKIDKEWNTCEEENYHSEGSLLMAVHYGIQADVELIKQLIVEQRRTLAPNPPYMQRIKMTSEWYVKHKKIINKVAKK